MKHLLKKLALLAIPLVLYLAFFVSFEPNNYFGLRAGAASTAPIARVRAFEENPGDYQLLGDSRLAHFDMDLAAEVSGKVWQNLAFGGASLRETLDLAEYALAQNPGVKELVLGLSFYTLNQSYDTDRMSDLQATLRNPAAYVLNLEYNVNTLTSFVNWTIWARQRLAGTTQDTWAQAQVERETGDWQYPADYTAPDGSPAEYSEDNVPLKPRRKLEISLDGYKPGDFTMVIGYPGYTDRYCSSAKVDFMENVSLPISNRLRGRQMEIISGWMDFDPGIRLLYSDYYFSLSNVQENNEGMETCFRRFGVAEEKRAQEMELQEWIDVSGERESRWGNMTGMLTEKYNAQQEAQKNIIYYRETLVRGTRFARTADRISSLANSVLKSRGIQPARAIDPAMEDKEKECRRTYRFIGKDFDCGRLDKDYAAIDLRVEKELFRYAVEQYYRNVQPYCFGPYQTELYLHFSTPDGECDFDALVDSLWNGSCLTDREKIEKMLAEEHTIDEYTADPMYMFLKDVSIIDFNRRISEAQGTPDIRSLEKEYTHALYRMRQDKGIIQYPDANSTMRITYGTVCGIEPRDAIICSWQTSTQGLLEKDDTSSYEFRLLDRQRELLLGLENPLPVDFLTDNDITGGNSGSPVMNAKGELIGLAFDGNKESLASDAGYTPGYNRCVCADIRFILWTLDEYAGMERILDEIGYVRRP